MLDLMSDIRRSDVVVKALGIVLDNDFALTLAFVLSLYEFLLDVIVTEWLYEGTELLLLVVAGGAPGVHEDGWADDRGQDFGFFEFSLVDVEDDEEVEVDALVIISGRRKFDCTKIHLPVDHLHLALPADAHIDQGHPVSFFIFGVFFDSEDLGLRVWGVT